MTGDDNMTECFADSIFGCTILTDNYCEGCSFRKNKEEYDESTRNSYEKLRNLSEEKQQYIAKKYYRNKKMWSD